MEELNKIKALLISEFEKKGDEKVLVSGNTTYTGNQIIEEINNQTEFGVNVIGNILRLSLNLLERGKETYPSPLPNGLPDDEAIKAKIKSLGWEVDGTAESNDMIELAKWMRSLAQAEIRSLKEQNLMLTKQIKPDNKQSFDEWIRS